MTIYHIFI
jgi:hypothetical protein